MVSPITGRTHSPGIHLTNAPSASQRARQTMGRLAEDTETLPVSYCTAGCLAHVKPFEYGPGQKNLNEGAGSVGCRNGCAENNSLSFACAACRSRRSPSQVGNDRCLSRLGVQLVRVQISRI